MLTSRDPDARRLKVDNPFARLGLVEEDTHVAVTGGFGRRSDRAFVKALAEASQIDLDVLKQRIDQLPASVHPQVRQAAHRTLNGRR